MKRHRGQLHLMDWVQILLSLIYGLLFGMRLPSTAQGLEVLQRRRQARLGVSRLPLLEPLGAKRESFYVQKLLCNAVL